MKVWCLVFFSRLGLSGCIIKPFTSVQWEFIWKNILDKNTRQRLLNQKFYQMQLIYLNKNQNTSSNWILENTQTQESVVCVWVGKWHCGGVIHLAVTDYAAGTGVHTAAAVASLMGFNPTQRCHHNGTVNPSGWETSRRALAPINTHRCRCDSGTPEHR